MEDMERHENARSGSSRRRQTGLDKTSSHEVDSAAKRRKISDPRPSPALNAIAEIDKPVNDGSVPEKEPVNSTGQSATIDSLLSYLKEMNDRLLKIESVNENSENIKLVRNENSLKDGFYSGQVSVDVHRSQDGVASTYVFGAEALSLDENDFGNDVAPVLDENDNLPDFLGFSQASSSSSEQAVCDFEKAAVDMAAFFLNEANVGEALPDALAKLANDNLRKRPIDSKIKELAATIHCPSNVPNLKVPAVNKDVGQAMSQGTKALDLRLTNTNTLISKAMVPLLTMIKDVGLRQGKPLAEYTDELQNSLRLLLAAFNYLNQARKELVRGNIRDAPLQTLCTWDYEVGTDELFPFNVSKRCSEMAKARKLGHSYRSAREFRGRPYAGRSRGGRGQFRRSAPKQAQTFLWSKARRGKNHQDKF